MAAPNKPQHPPGPTPPAPGGGPADDPASSGGANQPARPRQSRPPPGSSDRSQGTGRKGQPQTLPALRGPELGRARVLEHTGDHAQAAALRLEYAHTLCGTVQRIAMLREGCARNSGASEEGRALHQALAETLLRHAEFMEDGAPRRAILMEAARALEEADQGAVAGEIYERLSMLRRAARAYERAGAITQLEYVLGLLDRHEQIDQALQEALSAVDAALREGHRLLAHSLLQEHLGQRRSGMTPMAGPGAQARGGLVQRQTSLEAALPRGPRLTLRWPGGTTQVLLGPRLRIGRAPDVELPLPGAGLSREHVALTAFAGAHGLAIAVQDLGSKAGSFWSGEALAPGEPIELGEPGELGLGFGDSVPVHPLREAGELGALLQVPGAPDRWLLFLPGGGPLWLDPGHPLPVRVDLRPPFVGVQLGPEIVAHLGGEPLGPGASVELVIGDRLHLSLPAGRLTLEVGP